MSCLGGNLDIKANVEQSWNKICQSAACEVIQSTSWFVWLPLYTMFRANCLVAGGTGTGTGNRGIWGVVVGQLTLAQCFLGGATWGAGKLWYCRFLTARRGERRRHIFGVQCGKHCNVGHKYVSCTYTLVELTKSWLLQVCALNEHIHWLSFWMTARFWLVRLVNISHLQICDWLVLWTGGLCRESTSTVLSGTPPSSYWLKSSSAHIALNE